MFRVSFFCEDKKLADVLHNLMGLAAGMPEVQPVANAKKENGKVQAAGDLTTQFAAYAKKHKMTKFKAADLNGFCKEAGLAQNSRGYLIKKLSGAGLLKKHGAGTNTNYTVIA